MDNAHDLRVMLTARSSLVLAEAAEEQRFLATLRSAADDAEVPVWTWSATKGLARDGMPAQYGTTDPRRALDFVAELSEPGAFVFLDAHPILEDAVVVRLVKEVAQELDRRQTLLLTAPRHKVPPELQHLAHRWTLRPPGPGEIEKLVRRTVGHLAARFPVTLGENDIADMVDALRGLGTAEAERLIQQAALADRRVSPSDVAAIRTAKAELLAADGILEMIESDEGSLADVGGLDRLRRWLEVRGQARRAGSELGLDPPRGLLLTGVPGCGKSLIARALARSWEIPLVLLDPARLYGKYVGQSEGRLDQALTTVEAMAPVVLWIDEIEKGFTTGGEDSGVSRRILGTFLRWLQDRGDDVFVVATANDVRSLPPELFRRGRFDGVFFVDLPDRAARRRIFELHLARRNHDPRGFDVDALAAATDGFSGAEIEAAVVGGMYRAFEANRGLDQDRLHTEIAATVPLSVQRAEEIAALRAWAAERATPA